MSSGWDKDIFSTSSPLNSTTSSDYGDSSTVDVGRIVLVVASFVIGILGVCGNGIVILVCIRYPLRGVTNILVCNQSIIDLFSSVVFVLRYGLFSNVALPEYAGAADFVCKIWISEYPLWALGVASTANLVYLTLERYIAVFYPITYRQNFTIFKAKLFAVLPWIVGILHELPWAMAHAVRENHQCSHQWWTDQIGFIIGVIVPINHYVVPLVIMGFVYTRILIKLRAVGPVREKSEKVYKSRSTRKSIRHFADRASRNVIKTMFMVSLTYLICWGPNEILYFYSNMGGYVDWNGVLYYYTVISALCNMCINPFIYAFHYQDFRAKLRKLFNIVSCKETTTTHESVDTSVSTISSRL